MHFNTQINPEKTEALVKDEKYISYKKWLFENGCVAPSLEYPVAFWEDGIIGARAKQNIPPNKVYVFVPFTICINLYKAKTSELHQVFQKRFFTKHSRGNDHILWVFVMYEKLKGPNSFWSTYFSTLTGFNNLIDWTDAELQELQDRLIVHDNTKWKERIERIWTKISGIIANYPEFFPPEADLKGHFLWAWRVCCTRGYAWEGGMLIPLADNMNHGEVYTSYDSEDKSVIQILAENRTADVDYSDFLGLPSVAAVEVDPRHNTNRLEKYLEKNRIVELNNIWQVDRILENYRSSSSEDDERNIAECTSDEESDYDEEDFDTEIGKPDGQNYFMMSTGVRTSFREGEQVLNAYGRLNNRNLLLDYGFATEDNRYDTVYFMLWLPKSGREGLVSYEEIEEKGDAYCESTELYGLKRKRLNLDVFIYYRELMGVAVKNFPSNIQTELEIIDKFLALCIQLHEDFTTSLEFDEDLLKRNISGRLRSALYYRINQKRIVLNQIKMLEVLRVELEKIQDGIDIGEHLKGRELDDIHSIYPLRIYLKSLESYLKKS